MATTKTRINISVSKTTRDILRALAKRDEMPVASKVVDLVEDALELEEDRALAAIVERRLKNRKNIRWLSHEQVWGPMTKKNTR